MTRVDDEILGKYFEKNIVSDWDFSWWKKNLTRTERKYILNPYKKERAEKELELNLKHQFPIRVGHTETDFSDFIWFLYGGEFEKVFAELQ